MKKMIWPLPGMELFPDKPGTFGFKRRYDFHTGTDLYCERGTIVRSIDDGVVTDIGYFTGDLAGSPWWNNTYFVIVKYEHFHIVYGEIEPFCNIGQKINAGQVLGKVTTPVLKNFKGRPTTMLHFEVWNHKEANIDRIWTKEIPKNLLNSDIFLKNISTNLYYFDLNKYNKLDFR